MISTDPIEYPAGWVPYHLDNLSVDNTYGNAMYPGNYIDIYLKAVTKVEEGQALTDDDDKVMLGKLMTNIKVLAVKDSNGQPVFQNIDENRTPSMVVFSVPEENYILLKKAEYMRTYDTTLILVPTNESLKDEPGDTAIGSEQLKEWINTHTVWTEK